MAVKMIVRWLADRDTDNAVAERLGIPFMWFSWNISKAMTAVASLSDKWDFCLSYYKTEGRMTWQAVLTSRIPLTDPEKQHVLGYEQYKGDADTAALAICRAILDMPKEGKENDQEATQSQAGQEGDQPSQGGAEAGSPAGTDFGVGLVS